MEGEREEPRMVVINVVKQIWGHSDKRTNGRYLFDSEGREGFPEVTMLK